MSTPSPPFPGTVYGLVLNVRGAVEALGGQVHMPPYKAPPRAPVLYVKPPNTWLPSGGTVAAPAGGSVLQVQPTLGLVIGRTATRIAEAEAWSHVSALVLAAEVCLPHASLHRPAIRQRCRDGFLPMGSPQPVRQEDVEVRLRIDGELQATLSTAELVRPVPRLLAEVTDFMTLSPGDVLFVGLPVAEPLAGPGDEVAVEADGFPTLSFRVASELDLDEGETA